MNYQIHDILTLKKKHVCGSFDWTVLRTGAEIKLKCSGCGREIMILKKDLDRRITKITKFEKEEKPIE